MGSALSGIEVFADSTVAVEQVLLAEPALTLTAPSDGARVGTEVELRWRAVPSAVRYTLRVARGDGAGGSLNVETNSFLLSEQEGFVQPGALYRWEILAFDAQGAQLTGSDRPWLFRVEGP